MPAKRARSSSPPSERSHKRHAPDVIYIDDDEDDLQAILAQIKQQEESEALARRLQQEWAAEDANSTADAMEDVHMSSSSGPDDNPSVEDDETMARRLAAEWAAEDAPERVSIRKESSSHTQRDSSSSQNHKADRTNMTATEKLEFFRELFTGTRNCVECDHEVLSPRAFVTYSAHVPPPSLISQLHAHCPNCDTNHCRGCFRRVHCPPNCRGKDSNKGKEPMCPVLTCCPAVRAVALFEALGAFDRHFLGERANSEARAKEAVVKYRNSHKNSVGPGGTGYGTGSDYHGPPRGRGRGRQPIPEQQGSSSRTAELVAHADVISVRALTTITALLPSPYQDSPRDYDLVPHESLVPLLAVSQLPNLLGNLLRNDSVTDWTGRADVYCAMLGLLRRMADCELTLEVLVSPGHEMESSGGLEEWMWGECDITWAQSDNKLQEVNPLYSYFQKLSKQCEAFMAGVARLMDGTEDADDDMDTLVKSVSLCGEILATRDDLERATKVLNKLPQEVDGLQLNQNDAQDKDKGKGRAPDPADVELRYTRDCERLAFDHILFPQESGRYTNYNFVSFVDSTARSSRNPKDRLHMTKELAVMATSLPPGIWVRVDEVRNDVIKIMIAGPEGTPYAGGLFEFDCFLPLEYPHKPPVMHLRTTGGGTVRFNPNLYNNGKVCLSLLGTWAGRPEEQWSSKSTLLQVLVSIQSMILIELPYFNEPGFGQADPHRRESIDYNKNIMLQTTRWAMIEWMKDEYKDSLWADVIYSHFSIRANKIRECIHKWAIQEPAMRKYGARTGYQNPVYTAFPGSQNLEQNGRYMNLLEEYDKGISRIMSWNVR